MAFDIYHGTVQGYNKFVESTTSISGGEGKIRTSSWTGKVSGKISPVKSTTTHTHYTEFFIQEDGGREVVIRLINTPLSFYNGQQITAYKVHVTGQLYKIITHNSGTSTVVRPLSEIISQSHFFRRMIKHNEKIKLLWYAILVMIIGWCGWIFLDIFTHSYNWFTIIIGLVFTIPAYLLYKIARRRIAGYVAGGLAEEIQKWD